AEHLDAHDGARAGVVGDIENRLHLNHWASPSNLPGARIGQFWTPSGAKKTRILVRRRCRWQGSRGSLPHTSFDFSIRPVTVHDFVFEIGRHSAISTRSPFLYSPDGTCAWYLLERVTVLPIRVSFTRRSIRTVTVFCMRSLTTRPTSVRRFFAGLAGAGCCSLIFLPSLSAPCARARCPCAACVSGWYWTAVAWRAASAGRTGP